MSGDKDEVTFPSRAERRAESVEEAENKEI